MYFDHNAKQIHDIRHNDMIRDAEQARLAQQALAQQPGPSLAETVRTQIGGALVRIGSRLQDRPTPVRLPQAGTAAQF
jgi:hypothetical protein